MEEKKQKRDDARLKSSLLTCDIPITDIAGLYHAEHHPPEHAFERYERDTKERYSHEEVYGQWCNVNAFIDVPVDFAYEYLGNIYSLEEWTYNIRNLSYVGDGIYRAHDLIAPKTTVFIKTNMCEEASTIDYQRAWDQKDDLWMCYFFRLIDSSKALNRPGTVLSWLDCKHPNYEKNSHIPKYLHDIKDDKSRQWLSDYWRYIHAAHSIEIKNLRYILEHRFHKIK